MKKIILAILITCAFFDSNAQNTAAKPSIEETVSYINKIIKGCENFEVVYSSGSKYKLKYSYGDEYALRYLVLDEQDLTGKYCSTTYKFEEIDYAKMLDITMSESEYMKDSPVKFLEVKFLANSVLQKGKVYDFDTSQPCGRDASFRKSVSTVFFPYRNEPGVKERLVKALTHLSNLRKEEVKKNDLFGN